MKTDGLKKRLKAGILPGAIFLFLCLLPAPAFYSGPNAVVHAAEAVEPGKDIPAKGMVTMVDLGAKKCIPCKMMAPILEKLEKTYEGKAVIHFYDVWENREPAKRFGIQGIPTQIFFDAEGKEVYRHVGFMSEEDIVTQLSHMGVHLK